MKDNVIRVKRHKVGAILPELVDPKPRQWSVVEDENAKINFDNTQMDVPLDASEHSIATRAHEMGHVHWTPDDLDQRGISHELVNAVEDGRINNRLKRIGIKPPYFPDEPGFDFSLLHRHLRRDPLMASAIRAAVEGTGFGSTVAAAIKEIYPEDAKWIESQVARLDASASAEVSVDVAKEFYERFSGGKGSRTVNRELQKAIGVPWRPSPHKKKSEYEALASSLPALDLGGIDESDLLNDGLERLENIRRYIEDMSSDVVEWCRMTTDAPQRPLRILKGKGRGHRGEYYGRAPRYPHRMYTDLRIFANKKGSTAFPGAVLIDASGSMHLTVENIEEIIKLYPAAEIRIYASDGANHGILRTIAKAGKRVLDRHLDLDEMGGNGVDGPALEWLAKAPRPRFWIADAIVTGVSDSTSLELFDECMEIVARGRIIQFPTLEAFADRLKK